MDAFDRMREEGIEPDVVTWNTLIDAHCKGGRHDRAMELFEEMRESNCPPGTTTYNIMINLLGEQERWEGVEAMLSEMKEQGLVPNIITYTTLVDVYGRSGRYKEAIDCIEAMKADGLKPSPTMYHALVNAYAQRVRKSYIVAYFSTIVTNKYPVPTPGYDQITHPESLDAELISCYATVEIYFIIPSTILPTIDLHNLITSGIYMF